MVRTVDLERHRARRLQIIDAGLTCFAASGYAGTTTATLCRAAGIGSGTFFHYFPTKQDLLLAILDLGTEETRAWFASRDPAQDPRSVLDAHVARTLDEVSDPRIAGFVRAVGAVMGEPAVEAALARDTRVLEDGLEPWVARAQALGQARVDVPAAQLTAWVMVVLDGFVGRLATDESFTVPTQGAMVQDTVRRLLAPSTTA